MKYLLAVLLLFSSVSFAYTKQECAVKHLTIDLVHIQVLLDIQNKIITDQITPEQGNRALERENIRYAKEQQKLEDMGC